MPIVMALCGLFLGAVLERHGGWLYGGLAGLALGLGLQLRAQVVQLRRQIAELRLQLSGLEHTSAAPDQAADSAESEADGDSGDNIQTAALAADAEPEMDLKPAAAVAADSPAAATSTYGASPQAESELPTYERPQYPPAAGSSRESPPLDRLIAVFLRYFTSGNVIAKVGVIVLFFGVGFLVKYAADSGLLPVTARLAGVALAGLAMLGAGWRMRNSKRIYALIIQGGGIGILYLTTFAAYRVFHLLPATLTFALMLALTVVGVVLAVAQNAQALAALAVTGGFLAPVLASTGSGSHVALFSYYLILNLGILTIAWNRSWRLLNLLGFVFTFMIGALWGGQYYQPRYFATTEPFLIAFYLLYLTVTILYAFRQPVRLRGYVDASLVFGLPLVAFALQRFLVADFEYGLAWSSAVLAVLYALLTITLWWRLRPESRLLCEAFAALAVIFATLVIPFALDASWTSAMWALEGAAMVWVGGRQQRLLARLFGYLLQLLAAGAFVWSLDTASTGEWLVNPIFMGTLMLALGALFTAGYLMRTLPHQPTEGRLISRLFLIAGLCWWYGGGLHEIFEHAHTGRLQWTLVTLFFVASSALAHRVQGWAQWRDLRYPAHSLLPLLYWQWLWCVLEFPHPLSGWNSAIWMTALATHGWILRRYDDWQTRYIQFLHMGGLWLLLALLAVSMVWWVDRTLAGSEVWNGFGLIMPLLVCVYVLQRFGRSLPWPVAVHQRRYRVLAMAPVVAALAGWLVLINVYSDGNASPLSYWPVLNPLDIASALVLWVGARWLRHPYAEQTSEQWHFAWGRAAVALLAFGWLNAQWLRLAHHYWQIPFVPELLWRDTTTQTGLAILWALCGLSSMILGARRGSRLLWQAGAVLMAMVVIKLFTVDLAGSGTLARIVSFLSVGILLLAVGYFAPAPPRTPKEGATQAPP
ncbi:MAG: DUF2339 domain-containing protein [Wenzhouxiangellaceae bacterium]